MSEQFVIDPLDFVRKARSHHGRIPLADLKRLQDFLYENTGDVEYLINGVIDRNNRPYLRIKVKGEVHLCCQRCLGSLQHSLDIQTSLLLVEAESELMRADEDESVDALLATVDIDVLDLIEEEIILSLSISSRHNEGECDIFGSDQYKATGHTSAEHSFATLKTLKKT